jgi:uncharacterized membrane protein
MNRCISLEEYLEQFVDENTQPSDEEITLIIPDAEAQNLGLFFIYGLAGYIESVRAWREANAINCEADDDDLSDARRKEFIN